MAAKVFSDAGGNWSSNGAWVGGSPAGAIDTVTATGTSGNITIDVPSACTSIILTNYVGILTFNATLTVGGTVTFVSGMGTIAGTSDLICTVGTTLTSGTKVLSGGLQLQGTNQTFTLGDNWSITGVLNFNGTTGTVIGCTAVKTITVAGGLTVGVTVTVNSTNTPAISMTGGSWTGTGILRVNLELKGTITLLSGTLYYDTKTLTYTSGVITITGNTISVGTNVTFNTSGMNWNNITTTGGTGFTFTLSSALNATGTFTCTTTGTVTMFGNYAVSVAALTMICTGSLQLYGNWTVSGALTMSDTGACGISNYAGQSPTLQAASCTFTTGTGYYTISIVAITITGSTTVSASITLNGTGTWHTAGASWGAYTFGGSISFYVTGGTFSGSGTFGSYLYFAGGTVTCSGTLTVSAATINWTSGTVVAPTTLVCTANPLTLTTDPIQWNSVTLPSATITLNSLLTATGTLTLPNSGNVTFVGSYGFTCGTFTNTALTNIARTYTFVHGVTYTVTGTISVSGNASVSLTLISDHATLKAIITVQRGATQDIGFVTATRIDSSAGQVVYDYHGTVTTCLNWNTAIGAPATVAFTFA
jgi:hypothetical protein